MPISMRRTAPMFIVRVFHEAPISRMLCHLMAVKPRGKALNLFHLDLRGTFGREVMTLLRKAELSARTN